MMRMEKKGKYTVDNEDIKDFNNSNKTTVINQYLKFAMDMCRALNKMAVMLWE